MEYIILPLVTIGMPIYNAGEHLSLAVISIMRQSFTNWEMFIIDDGSSDQAIDNLAWVSDQRIKIIKYSENRGLAFRLNECIDLACGSYFARMDQDDVCHPNRLLLQLEFMHRNSNVDLLGGQCVTIDQTNNFYGFMRQGVFQKDICSRPWHEIKLPHPTWFGRTDWFKIHKYKLPPSFLSEDQELLLRAKDVSTYDILSDYILAYRIGRKAKLIKQHKTRFSLLKVRSIYFFNKKQYASLILSVIAFIACVVKDSVDYFVPLGHYIRQLSSRNKTISHQEKIWNNLIKTYIEEISLLQAKDETHSLKSSNE